VLDAWAVLALLRDEPGGADVEVAIDRGDALMSWINLGEVLYVESRRVGETLAMAAIAAVEQRVQAEPPDRGLVLAAARLKAAGGLSYADCFALATAERHRAPLLTGDGEIIEGARGIEVIDLQRRPGPAPGG
jgi:PIN domain nuclease of toxin-antitoxin system